jgi:HD-GYP domain-containing protein (c-di-GMP phosphodiesterase class II)
MANVYDLLEKAQLPQKLTPISIRELLFINTAPCDIYGREDELFKVILPRNAFINKEIVRDLLVKGKVYLFVKSEDRKFMIESLQNNLTQLTRSLSIGDAYDKAKKQMNLMTINLGHLYRDPIADETLQIQYLCSKSLAYFLMKNLDLLEPLYADFIKQKHHYIYMQPLISSLFVLGVLKQGGMYNDQEVENLFITSYFKDVGMSIIPPEKYDREDLTDDEKKLLMKHPEFSVNILKGRLPLLPSHFNIIRNHHVFSMLGSEVNKIAPSMTKNGEVFGFETVIISAMDIISAMITPRPYRESTKIFESLDLIRVLISTKYPAEFRLIVSFFKSFFLNR